MADFLGNLFACLVDGKMEGPGKKQRCEQLWRLVQAAFYRRKGMADKLEKLVPSTLAKAGQLPKLRRSAAQSRATTGWRARGCFPPGGQPLARGYSGNLRESLRPDMIFCLRPKWTGPMRWRFAAGV